MVKPAVLMSVIMTTMMVMVFQLPTPVEGFYAEWPDSGAGMKIYSTDVRHQNKINYLQKKMYFFSSAEYSIQ